MIEKLINDFYHNDFDPCKELIVEGRVRDTMIEYKKRADKLTLASYDIITQLDTVIANIGDRRAQINKYYRLTIGFDKRY